MARVVTVSVVTVSVATVSVATVSAGAGKILPEFAAAVAGVVIGADVAIGRATLATSRASDFAGGVC